MLKLTQLHSRSSHSPTQSINTSSSALSSTSRLSVPFGLRRSHESDSTHKSSGSYQYSSISPSSVCAEDMDDDNIAWGPVSRKKWHS